MESSKFSNMVSEFVKYPSEQLEQTLLQQLTEFCQAAMVDELQQKQTFLSMSTLLTAVDPHSPLAWSTVKALDAVFDAPIKECSMIYIQQLLPVLSKLSRSATKEEHQIQLLKALQKITYTIKVPGPDPSMLPLISSLISWIKAGCSSSVLPLSLSVLTNLLHLNKGLLSTVMEAVPLKQLLHYLLRVEGNMLCRMEVCKLMFLFEEINCEKQNEAEVLNFIRVTMCTVLEIGSQRNTLHLQHCIAFFGEMVSRKKISAGILDKPSFIESVKKVINLVHDLRLSTDNTGLENAMVLFRFLGIITGLKIKSFLALHREIMKEGLAWVAGHTSKAGDALNTIHSIMVFEVNNDCGLSADDIMMVILPLLEEYEDKKDHSFAIILLRFLRATLNVKDFCVALKGNIKEEVIKSFLESIDDLSVNNSLNEEAVIVVVLLLDFISQVCICCDATLLTFYTNLFREQKIIKALALALAHGSTDIKTKILFLIGDVSFPKDCIVRITKSMEDLPPKIPSHEFDSHVNELALQSKSTTSEITQVIQTVKNAGKCKKDIANPQIMKLYEFKDQLNLEYQRSLITSLNQANMERALLQEQVYTANQLIMSIREELSLLHGKLDDMSSKYNDAVETRDKDFAMLKIQFDEETAASQRVIKTLRETEKRKEMEIQNLRKHTNSLKLEMSDLLLRNETLEGQVTELTKEIMDVNEMRKVIENLTEANESLEKQLNSKIAEVTVLSRAVSEKEADIQELQRLRDMVYEITVRSKKP